MIATAYREMHNRKGFTEYVDIDEFRLIQQDLADALKMKIIACQSNGDVHAALIFLALGNMGLGLLGATSEKGLKSGGLHFLMWKSIEWLKAGGYRWYDLGGYNPDRVPGTGYEGKIVNNYLSSRKRKYLRNKKVAIAPSAARAHF